MASKRTFVSYDHSEDAHYRRLLEAWDANTDFDFEFDLRSPSVAIDSEDGSVIQGVLTKKMKEADYILVIIGEKSHSSKWMRWEIDRAQAPDVLLRFAAVRIKSTNQKPANLPSNTAIAEGFELAKIVSALEKATIPG